MAENSFIAAASNNNTFTRKFGTTNGEEVQPFLSGRGFVEFTGLPALLPNVVNANRKLSHRKQIDSPGIKSLLESTNLSLTIPGKTVNKTEFTGLGGITWGVPTNVQVDSTISMRFFELANTPLLSIFHGWVRLIQDTRNGVSLLGDVGAGGDMYLKQNYACNAFYWTTQPDGATIDYAACFTGVFPMRDPADQFGFDLASIDKVEMDIDFSFDYMFEEDWVYQQCNQYSTNRKGKMPSSYSNELVPTGALDDYVRHAQI
jgi:hypothetical protein